MNSGRVAGLAPAIEKSRAKGAAPTAAGESEIDERPPLLHDGGSRDALNRTRRGVGPISNIGRANGDGGHLIGLGEGRARVACATAQQSRAQHERTQRMSETHKMPLLEFTHDGLSVWLRHGSTNVLDVFETRSQWHGGAVVSGFGTGAAAAVIAVNP